MIRPLRQFNIVLPLPTLERKAMGSNCFFCDFTRPSFEPGEILEILKKAVMVNIDQHPDLYGDKMTLWSVAGFDFVRPPDSTGVHQMPSSHPLPSGPSVNSIPTLPVSPSPDGPGTGFACIPGLRPAHVRV